jgi:hypothetical protein
LKFVAILRRRLADGIGQSSGDFLQVAGREVLREAGGEECEITGEPHSGFRRLPPNAEHQIVDRTPLAVAPQGACELDEDGKKLRVKQFTEYTAEKVRGMYPSASELRAKWSNAARMATSAMLGPLTSPDATESASVPAAQQHLLATGAGALHMFVLN